MTRSDVEIGVRLPLRDEAGFLGIRLESIGGLGAHVAGQILAEAGVLGLGLNGANFSSYGSEKKGSPITSYIRFCEPEQEVRTSSPVDRPHVVAVFHEALIKTEPVISGLLSGGKVIVNTTRAHEDIWERLGRPAAQVGVVDAMTIAVEEKSRVNTAMLGSITNAIEFMDPEVVRNTIRGTLGERYPQLLESNLRTFDRGFEELRFEDFSSADEAVPQRDVTTLPPFGYLDAPVGGIILNPGNTVLKDLTASRSGFIPVFDQEKCIDCAMCDLICPDYCFVWDVEHEDGADMVRLKGIDYNFCKGCMKCIDACPTDALIKEREVEGYADSLRIPLFPQLEEQATVAAGDGHG